MSEEYHGVRQLVGDERLAFSSLLALLTSAFSNLLLRTSSIVSNRSATRVVYPASSDRSLYEYMTRPTASKEA